VRLKGTVARLLLSLAAEPLKETSMKTFTRLLMVLSMMVGLAACGPDGGGGKADSDAGSCTGVVPSLAAQQVIGSWKQASGTTNCTCNNGQTIAAAAEGSDEGTISVGCEPDQVILYDSSSTCPETCTVSGNTVTCDPFSCETPTGLDLQTTSDVYTLSNGQLAEVSAGVLTNSAMTCQCATNDSIYTRIQ
jgi:hypothetical protein